MTSRGIALVVTLIAMAAFSALGLGLVLTTSAERLTGGNYRDGVDALYAADAALELAVRELNGIADWDRVLQGVTRSGFTDGAASGSRVIGGESLDLTTLTNELTCGRSTACADARIRQSTIDRPWGANNPRWELFLFGPLATFVDARHPLPRAYVVVWIGDDAREVDGNRLVDGGGASGEGRGILRARAEAFTATGASRAIEADLIRQGAGIHVQSWRLAGRTLP